MYRVLLWAIVLVPAGSSQTAEELARAVKAKPGDSRLQNAYGIALQQQGEAKESVLHFQIALQLDPAYRDAAYNLALALLSTAQPAKALETLAKYPGETADYYALKGSVLHAMDKLRDAVVALRRASRLAPRNPDYAYDLIVVLMKAEKLDDAAVEIASARKRFPRTAKVYAASGMLAYLKGENEKAAEEYKAATRLEPQGADLWAALGDIYAATNHFSEAEEVYARSIGLDPRSPEYRVKSGRNLMKLQRADEAEAAFRSAISLNPDDAEARFELGKIDAGRGETASAIQHLEHAVAAKPSMGAAWYQLSLSYRKNGQVEKSQLAMEQFRKTQ